MRAGNSSGTMGVALFLSIAGFVIHCSRNVDETNVVGRWRSISQPTIELIVLPGGTFVEKEDSITISGRWVVEQVWVTNGDFTQLEMVGFRHSQASTDSNKRSHARLRWSPAGYTLVIQESRPTIELIRVR